MSQSAWRITKHKHANVAFTGGGAEQNGGRWNSQGTRIVYTASSISLGLLEILAHVGSVSLLSAYVVIRLEFEPGDIAIVELEDLPPGWSSSPPTQGSQSVGDDWVLSNESLILQVPSAIVPMESNFLVNPAHPRFVDLAIGEPIDLPIDPRLRRV